MVIAAIAVAAMVGVDVAKATPYPFAMAPTAEHLHGEICAIIQDFLDLKPLHNPHTLESVMALDEPIHFSEFIEAVKDSGSFPMFISLIADVYSELVNSDDEKLSGHHDMTIPYGPALVTLLGADSVIERELYKHPNPGIRCLVAHSTEYQTLLNLMSYDRCALVRTGVAINPDTSDLTLMRLAGDPFQLVRKAFDSIDPEKEFDFPEIRLFGGESCVCHDGERNEECEDFFNDKGLDIPPLDEKKITEITEFSDWHWATQPFPTPMQDYMLDCLEYLKGPVPDQYSISHAGHGVNSYSLNFRYVGGDFAIIAQSGWGGVYMDEKSANDDWDYLQGVIGNLLINAFIEDNSEIRTRKYLVVYSNFRLENDVQLWVNEKGKWSLMNGFVTLENVCDYLIRATNS